MFFDFVLSSLPFWSRYHQRAPLPDSRHFHASFPKVSNAVNRFSLLATYISHSHRARCTGGTHSTQWGICTGIDRELKTGVTNISIQCITRNTGLYCAVEIIRVDSDNLVHTSQIETDATLDNRPLVSRRRWRMTYLRGSDTTYKREEKLERRVVAFDLYLPDQFQYQTGWLADVSMCNTSLFEKHDRWFARRPPHRVDGLYTCNHDQSMRRE